MVPGFKAKEIKPTKTVGERLKAARKKKELTLPAAEQLTKVKLKYLKALEEDRHDLLPTEVYSLGFLRCYGEVLGLNTTKLLELYRQERRAFKSAKGPTDRTLAPARRLGGPSFLLTPKALFSLLSVGLVGGLLLYLALGVRSFLAPPELVIEQPRPDSRIQANVLTVEGATDPSVTLSINGEIIAVDTTGKFKREIAVVPGLNTLEFAAVNRLGKETKQTRKVLAEYTVAPSPDPSGEQPTDGQPAGEQPTGEPATSGSISQPTPPVTTQAAVPATRP